MHAHNPAQLVDPGVHELLCTCEPRDQVTYSSSMYNWQSLTTVAMSGISHVEIMIRRLVVLPVLVIQIVDLCVRSTKVDGAHDTMYT